MNNQTVSCIVRSFAVNGNEDDVKFVEVDGKKFQADDKDPAKPKLDDKGQPVPFVEKQAPAATDKKVEEMELEELAKTNPHVAKMLDEQKKRDEEAAKAEIERKKKEDEEAAKKGEWQKLAEDRAKELEEAKTENKKKDEILGKYVGSVKQILEQVIKDIPKENLGLIPENFSPREKLEYITKNAKLLGIKSIVGKGGGVDKNEVEVEGTELEKAEKEFEDLRKKENKTQSDFTKMQELGKKIKELRVKAKK